MSTTSVNTVIERRRSWRIVCKSNPKKHKRSSGIKANGILNVYKCIFVISNNENGDQIGYNIIECSADGTLTINYQIANILPYLYPPSN